MLLQTLEIIIYKEKGDTLKDKIELLKASNMMLLKALKDIIYRGYYSDTL